MSAVSFAAWALLALGAGPKFTVSRIPLPEGIKTYWTARLDGDELEDLVVGGVKPGGERELAIHFQRPDGRFLAEPDRRIALKPDIVAFSFADVRPEPGEEILFFTATSCFSFSTASAEFSGNAKKLFNFDLLCDLPDPGELVEVRTARPAGGGNPLLILPGPDGYGFFELVPGQEPAALRGNLAGDPAPAQKRGGRRLSIVVGRDRQRDPFEGLVISESPARAASDGSDPLLDVKRWLPAPALVDADGDGRPDVLHIVREPGGRFLLVYARDGEGGIGAPRRSGPFPGDGPLILADLDGDRAVDLIAGDPDGADHQVYRFFKSRGGSFDATKPDQVMKFSGYGVKASVVDVDGDGRPELVVSSYEVPVTEAVTGGRIRRGLFVHRRDPERVFEPRPALKHEETFGARDVKGIALRIDLGADLLGRKLHDALLVDRDGALAAHHLGADLAIEGEPFWRFTPEKMILGFRPLELNGDGRSDIIIQHTGLLTVLVSRP
jgi:VCBS repeat protein